MKAIFAFLLFSVIIKPAISQDYALKQLESSPRHHEWVEVNYDERTVHCFMAYPEVADQTLAVIVIHENRGLTDWVRSFADQLAAEGYLAIAPDLLSEFDEDHAKTSDFESSDAARSAIYELDDDQVTNDLVAVQAYIKNVPACNGKTVVAGFCWGGSQSFHFATYSEDIEAALVFYGSAPEDQGAIDQIEAPVYGFYGEIDERINSKIPATETMMEKANNTYKYVIYDGAGHAYMRRGDDPEEKGANKEARDQSWDRLLSILNDI